MSRLHQNVTEIHLNIRLRSLLPKQLAFGNEMYFDVKVCRYLM